MKKAYIAMSGGVDSAVSALLMKEKGYDCTGVTMINRPTDTDSENCCGTEKLPASGVAGDAQGYTDPDAVEASKLCDRLGITHITVDLRGEFRQRVIHDFITEYEAGRTPNPCVMCNPEIKFGCLLEYVKKEYLKEADGMTEDDFVFATGHYAGIDYDEKNHRYRILKALDEAKDQSYMLYRLSQEQLKHVCFPLGGLKKADVRKIAETNGFEVAHKHDSQDICFVPDGDYAGFIERTTGKTYPKGCFKEMETGKILGEHKGLIHYTTGQRKGLGLALPAPLYVYGKDLEKNEVLLCPNDKLFTSVLSADRVNFVSIPEPVEGTEFKCIAKARYSHKAQPATAVMDNGKLKVVFDEPQRAITPGQSVVLYDGDILLGGGII